jgi:hypothetical protein
MVRHDLLLYAFHLLTRIVTAPSRCQTGRLHRFACQIEEEGCSLPL